MKIFLSLMFYLLFIVYYSVQRVRMFYNDKKKIVEDCKAVLHRARQHGIYV